MYDADNIGGTPTSSAPESTSDDTTTEESSSDEAGCGVDASRTTSNTTSSSEADTSENTQEPPSPEPDMTDDTTATTDEQERTETTSKQPNQSTANPASLLSDYSKSTLRAILVFTAVDFSFAAFVLWIIYEHGMHHTEIFVWGIFGFLVLAPFGLILGVERALNVFSEAASAVQDSNTDSPHGSSEE